MPDEEEPPPLAPDMAQAPRPLKASHDSYREILAAIREAGEAGGDPDLPALFARLNRALTEFAAWDRQIKRLLERYGS